MAVLAETIDTALQDMNVVTSYGGWSAATAKRYPAVISGSSPMGLKTTADRIRQTQRPPGASFESLAQWRIKLLAEPVSTTTFASVVSENWSITAEVKITLLPPWEPQIAAAGTHEEIIAVLRLFGLDAIADRLGYLRGLAADDPDESLIKIESLKALASFLMSERQLLDPEIGVGPDGLAQIQWRIPANGILAMEFLPSGRIRFAAISAPAQHGVERRSVNGTLPKDEALEAVRPFTSRLRLR